MRATHRKSRDYADTLGAWLVDGVIGLFGGLIGATIMYLLTVWLQFASVVWW